MQDVQSIDRKCFLCGSSRQEIVEDFSGAALFLENDFFKVDIKKVLCPDCGLIYASRYLNPEYLSKMYASFGMTPAELSDVPDFPARHDFFINSLNEIFSRTPKSILDIGCRKCETLDSFKKRGWKTYGVDISPLSPQIGMERGHHIWCGSFQDIDFGDLKFDAILLEVTLDHIPNPVYVLSRITSLLNNSGCLAVSVPESYTRLKNMDVSDILAEDHCNHFVPLTLQRFLKSEGLHLRDLYIDTEPPAPVIKVLAFKQPREGGNVLDDLIGLNQLKEAIDSYRQMKLKLNNVFSSLINKYKRVVVYCAGTYTTVVLPSFFGYNFKNCLAFVDNDVRKYGKTLFDRDVLPSSKLKVMKPDAVLISSKAFEDEIYNNLKPEFPNIELICANRLLKEILCV
ncbi:MAG: class I SAM-dependent methyltransferase [Deltaproteobacteria bacterium]|nr:class I SAM-dependent methyltransferase [Deltaproteobacteria bacterium]